MQGSECSWKTTFRLGVDWDQQKRLRRSSQEAGSQVRKGLKEGGSSNGTTYSDGLSVR